MKQRSVYLALLLVQVLFGTMPIAVKVALRDLSSPGLALLRVSFAAILFVVLQRVLVGERIRRRRDYLELALYSLFGVVCNQLLYITSLTLTTATAAQTCAAAGPAMTLLFAILLRRESATPLKWVGIALAASGALSLIGGAGGGAALGNLLALLNTACFAIYLVISRGLAQRYHPLTIITWVFVLAVPGMLPWGAGAVLADARHAHPATWLALAWIVIGPTVGAYYLNVYALAKVESSVVSTFIYLQPLVTAALAVWLLDEIPSPRVIPAGLLIFAGVAVTVWAGRRARARGAVQDAQELVEE